MVDAGCQQELLHAPACASLGLLPTWQLGSKDKVSQESQGGACLSLCQASEISEPLLLPSQPPCPQIQAEGMQTLHLDRRSLSHTMRKAHDVRGITRIIFGKCNEPCES